MNHIKRHILSSAVAVLALSLAVIWTPNAHAEDVRVQVDGMFCVTCEAKVKGVLDALPFLSETTASTPSSQACSELSGVLNEDAIRSAIASLDYTVTAIEVMKECSLEARRYPENWAETEGLDVRIISRGEEVDLSAHHAEGKFTIFDFGAPWCGPCHVAEKLLRDYVRDHEDVAVRAIVLDAQDPKKSFDMPVVSQHLQSAPGLPYFVLVNPKGKTIARGVDPARILKKIDKKR